MFVRNVSKTVMTSLGLAEDQAPQKSFHPDDFDVGALPLKSPHYKASVQPRDPAEIGMIVVHVTGVRGGFGVSPYQRKAWERRMDSNGWLWLPAPLGALAGPLIAAKVLRLGSEYRSGKGCGYVMLDDPQRVAQRLALWERFRGTPYHGIVTRSLDVLYNRRLSQRSWHGNGGNDGVGFALDMHPSEDPGEDFAVTGRHGLNMLADRLAMARRDVSPVVVKVTSHRQHQYPGRANDPGQWVAENVVVPVVRERDDLVIAHGLTTGSGKPWPNKWDPASPYDMDGKRVDGR